MVLKDSFETNVTFMQLDAKEANPRGRICLGPIMTWTLVLQILNCMRILGNLTRHKVRMAYEDKDSRFTIFWAAPLLGISVEQNKYQGLKVAFL